MKAVMVMFDSLSRHMLPPYGCDWVHAPNFTRLAQRSVTFDRAYCASMPCIPARREMHTGRYNFLHRAWGPVEPFDDSVPELLKAHGIYTHLTSDHYHYWEDGGATYHERYSSWENFRGQEGDGWKGCVAYPEIPECVSPQTGMRSELWRHDWINRRYMTREADQPQARTFESGLEFIRTNAGQDKWFLQIETFDPHPPFFTQEHYRKLYPENYQGAHFDWPPYGAVTETPEQVEHARKCYAALVSMCDAHLGRVLDVFDGLNLWKDTLLIVHTDHGLLLGEHGQWNIHFDTLYNENARRPLFVWDPRTGRAGARCDALVQTLDLPATLLDFFGVDRPADMEGISMTPALAEGAQIRKAGIFGVLGKQVAVTDGRWIYYRSPATPQNGPLFEYTLMPTHRKSLFSPKELEGAELAGPFTFTKGCRVLKVRRDLPWKLPCQNVLYDSDADPQQAKPVHDAPVEARMIQHMVQLMRANDAPPEQFERLGLA